MKTFNDLIFKDNLGAINAKHVFDNKYEISVSAGQIPYSTPRKDNLDSSRYSSFEVAIFNEHGEFVTSDILGSDINEAVLGWQSRGEINTMMILIANIKDTVTQLK